jgi:hypothetical protein
MAHGIFSDPQAFEAIAASLLGIQAPGSFGRLHMVTINHGDDEAAWNRIQPKATAIAENIIGSRLSPDDACLRMARGQYMMLFPTLSETEGLIRASAIANEIKARLFGEADAGLEVAVQVLPLSRLKARDAATAVEAMSHVLSNHEKQNGIDLDVVFQPVWSTSRQEIVGNRARIRRRFNGRELFENAILFGGEQDPLAVGANTILQRSSMRAAKTGGVLFLPQAINDHAMTDETQVTESIRPLVTCRQGPLVIELAGAVATASHKHVRQIVRAILASGAKVAVRTVPDMETAKFLRDSGVDFLCLNLAQVRIAGLTTSAILALITVYAHEVQGLGLQLCLWNSEVSANVKRAVGLGYALFSGPVIGPHGETAVAPHALPTYKVFS